MREWTTLCFGSDPGYQALFSHVRATLESCRQQGHSTRPGRKHPTGSASPLVRFHRESTWDGNLPATSGLHTRCTPADSVTPYGTLFPQAISYKSYVVRQNLASDMYFGQLCAADVRHDKLCEKDTQCLVALVEVLSEKPVFCVHYVSYR